MIRRLGYRIGRRGAALLFLAGLDVVVAWSLFDPTDPLSPLTAYARAQAPLWLWGAGWAGTAALCAFSAFRRRDMAGFAAAMAIKVLWASLYIGGGVTGQIPRGLAGAAVWVAFALFVWLLSSWPEPTHYHTEDGS